MDNFLFTTIQYPTWLNWIKHIDNHLSAKKKTGWGVAEEKSLVGFSVTYELPREATEAAFGLVLRYG